MTTVPREKTIARRHDLSPLDKGGPGGVGTHANDNGPREKAIAQAMTFPPLDKGGQGGWGRTPMTTVPGKKPSPSHDLSPLSKGGKGYAGRHPLVAAYEPVGNNFLTSKAERLAIRTSSPGKAGNALRATPRRAQTRTGKLIRSFSIHTRGNAGRGSRHHPPWPPLSKGGKVMLRAPALSRSKRWPRLASPPPLAPP